tara:strand:+ start:197 stop:493 length:297 start_codon:yes stop_codon:yes gene_type:complete
MKMQYKLSDDDKTLAHNPAGQPKDAKKAMKKVTNNLKKASKLHAGQSEALAKASKMHGKQSAELAAASKMHAKDAETMSKLTKDMKRTKNPGYKMEGY